MHCIQELETSGARAVETFVHAGTRYLVVPQLARDVAGQPAQMTVGDSDTEALVYRWEGGRFVVHQTLSGPGGREFVWMQTAQGGRLVQINFLHGTREAPSPELESVIYRMAEGRMVEAERFPTSGGTDACAFKADGQNHLVVANSLSGAIRFATPSRVYRLDGPAT